MDGLIRFIDPAGQIIDANARTIPGPRRPWPSGVWSSTERCSGRFGAGCRMKSTRTALLAGISGAGSDGGVFVGPGDAEEFVTDTDDTLAPRLRAVEHAVPGAHGNVDGLGGEAGRIIACRAGGRYRRGGPAQTAGHALQVTPAPRAPGSVACRCYWSSKVFPTPNTRVSSAPFSSSPKSFPSLRIPDMVKSRSAAENPYPASP